NGSAKRIAIGIGIVGEHVSGQDDVLVTVEGVIDGNRVRVVGVSGIDVGEVAIHGNSGQAGHRIRVAVGVRIADVGGYQAHSIRPSELNEEDTCRDIIELERAIGVSNDLVNLVTSFVEKLNVNTGQTRFAWFAHAGQHSIINPQFAF